MSNHTGISPNNPLKYLGPNVYINSVVTRNREPTGADYRQPETGKLYPFSTLWLVSKNPTTGTQGDLWYLSKIVSNVAFWIKLSTGTVGPLIQFTGGLGTSGFPVDPNGLGQVEFSSNASSITITGSGNSINFDITGGAAITEFAVDVGPNVVPLANIVNFTGASSTYTNGVTANTLRTEVQGINHALFVGRGVNIDAPATTLPAATNGQIPIGSTGADPVIAALTAGANITITNGPGSIEIAATLQNFTVVQQVFTASGTYFPNANMKYAFIEVQAGGGAGGSAAATSPAQFSAASGGGAGEYAAGYFSAATIGASQAVTIGAAGIGNAVGNGGAGGNTSVGALISANGGNGGVIGLATTAATTSSVVGGTGGAGGTIRVQGACGGFGLASVSGTLVIGGQGGNSRYGAAGRWLSGGTVGGAAATGNGAGGGGALCVTSAAAQTGGNGSAGIVVITEYVSN